MDGAGRRRRWCAAWPASRRPTRAALRRGDAGDGQDLRVEQPFVPRPGGEALRAGPEGVGVLAADRPALGDAVGGDELADDLVTLSRAAALRAPDVGLGGTADPIGTALMFSTPQAITTSAMPPAINPWATVSACCDDPHCTVTVAAGTSGGRPATSAAVRVTLLDCMPT